MSFTIDDILKIAEQIEKSGAAFYSKVACLVPFGWARNILLGLATEEIKHQKVFSIMRADLALTRRNRAVPDGVEGDYLVALAGESLFRRADDSAAFLKSQKSLQAIIQMAITKEKESILLYIGLSSVLAKPVDKKKVRNIIRQEQKHLSTFVGLLNRIKKLGIK